MTRSLESMVSERSTLTFEQSVVYNGSDQLRVVKLTDYTAEKVRSFIARSEHPRACWADTAQRADRVKKKQTVFNVKFQLCLFMD